MTNVISQKDDKETKATLEWLESRCESLGDLLESYRYLQPDNKPFSANTVNKISRLERLHEALAHHEEERDYHMKMIQRYQHEVYCIENEIDAQEVLVDNILPESKF